MVLDGAPFGFNYASASNSGPPSEDELRAILDLAERHGVTHIDTAAGYGDSEHRIGSALTPGSPLGIVTRLPPNLLDGQPPAHEAEQRVHVAVDRSLWLLERQRLDAVLLDRFEHYEGPESAIWRTLLALKSEGKIGHIGAAIERPEELLALLRNPDVGLVQILVDVVHWAWLEPEIQDAIAARPDVVLHGCAPVPEDHRLEAAAKSLGRESGADFYLACARAQPWLDGIVMAAETAAQMAENIRLFGRPALTWDEARAATRRFNH
jgi:aryl-alcohol dehydrogenase-like predicted oxidoreductase